MRLLLVVTSACCACLAPGDPAGSDRPIEEGPAALAPGARDVSREADHPAEPDAPDPPDVPDAPDEAAPSATSAGFVRIEAGAFVMGAPADESCNRGLNEAPHDVTLTHTFELAATEVTFAGYEAAVGEAHPWVEDCPDCPATMLSWHGAAATCNALSERAGLTACYACEGEGDDLRCAETTEPYGCAGYRLPTEGEWEYAARAGTTTAVSAGDLEVCGDLDPTLDSIGWFLYNADGGTHPVAQKAANGWGLFDLHGNVWEWVADGYLQAASAAGETDPFVASEDGLRVMRGGSYNCVPEELRSAHRVGLPDTIAGLNVGVRCARTLP